MRMPVGACGAGFHHFSNIETAMTWGANQATLGVEILFSGKTTRETASPGRLLLRGSTFHQGFSLPDRVDWWSLWSTASCESLLLLTANTRFARSHLSCFKAEGACSGRCDSHRAACLVLTTTSR